MRVTENRVFARNFLRTHGDRAEVEAAQNATVLEEQGERDQAATWRRVQHALKELRGPRLT